MDFECKCRHACVYCTHISVNKENKKIFFSSIFTLGIKQIFISILIVFLSYIRCKKMIMAVDAAAIPGLFITGCVFCGLLAVIHIYIFILEAILWRKRAGKTFGLSPATVDLGAGLAANQGFYNLLLAVGLIWALAELNPDIMLFFLSAIFTAGIFGVITASPRILFVQVIPALLGFIFVDFGYFPTKYWSQWKHPLYLLLILTGAGLVTAALSVIIKKKFLDVISKPAPTDDNL